MSISIPTTVPPMCPECIGKPSDYRSEYGHLAMYTAEMDSARVADGNAPMRLGGGQSAIGSTMLAPHVAPVTLTELVIAGMLVENTGAHFLDSGGAYGRAFQHARARYGLDNPTNSTYSGAPVRNPADVAADDLARVALMMRAEPSATISEFGDVEISTFHWLTARLEYAAHDDRAFTRYVRWAESREDRGLAESRYWPELATDFLALVSAREGWDMYGGANKPAETVQSHNTYNGECSLDRTLQWFAASDGGDLYGDAYVALQVHGGADVRGGYTRPVIFRVAAGDGLAVLHDYADVTVYCAGADPNPDVTPGQLTIADPENGADVAHDPVSHSWDSRYDGYHLLRNDAEAGDYATPSGDDWQHHFALTFDRDAEPDAEPTAEPEDYRRDRLAAYDVARRSETGEWLCPFDGTALAADGPYV